MKSTIIKNGNNYTLTCVIDGEVISGQITPETAARKDLKELSKQEIYKLFIDKPLGTDYVDYEAFIKRLQDWNHPLLEYSNSRIQYKGIPLAIPEFLCKQMANAETVEELDALCNFWRNLALCPEPRVREGLFEYLTNNGFIITKQGLIVSLRRVRNYNEDSDEDSINDPRYVEAVTNAYFKIKRQKKGPKNFVIDADDSNTWVLANYDPDMHDVNLEQQYQEVVSGELLADKATCYFANHSSKTEFAIDGELKYGRVEYHLLKETRLSRFNCDHDPTAHCSTGLHLGTPEYVKSNRWLGSTILVCLSNPMDAVSVPEDGYMKFRTAALYPIAVVSEDDVDNFTQDSENTVEVFDEDYLNYTTEYIEGLIQTSTFEGLKDDFIIPRELRIDNIYSIIDDIKKVTLSRTQ
jgi:hypothetical protein